MSHLRLVWFAFTQQLKRMINGGMAVYLSGGRTKQMSSCEVKITDGCHGDCVTGVIVLHRLCCACYSVFQVIFSSLWDIEQNEKHALALKWYKSAEWATAILDLTESFIPLLQHLYVFLMSLKTDRQNLYDTKAAFNTFDPVTSHLLLLWLWSVPPWFSCEFLPMPLSSFPPFACGTQLNTPWQARRLNYISLQRWPYSLKFISNDKK